MSLPFKISFQNEALLQCFYISLNYIHCTLSVSLEEYVFLVHRKCFYKLHGLVPQYLYNLFNEKPKLTSRNLRNT